MPRTIVLLACMTLVNAASTRAGEPAPERGVAVKLNLSYRKPSVRACVLDLALPGGPSSKPRPAIVVIHGGGWIEGDKSSFATTTNRSPANIRDFAALGFVAASINYRLSKEARYPAQLDDCRCAVRWLRAHAAEYGVDRDRIGAYGNSAGGHLALLLALGDRPIVSGEPFPTESNAVQAAVSDSGPLDLISQYRGGALKRVVGQFMGGPPDGPRLERYREASPSQQVRAKGPPLLLIYGVDDEQVDVLSADRFVAALGKIGYRDLSYFRLAGVRHCPHSMVRIPYLRQAVNDFFLRTIGK